MNTNINQEVIVGGDMNGHVGQVANGFHEAHGNFGYGARNAEGERILEFAEAMGYVVTSSLFKKRQSHLVTYESGGNKTAIDMILIKREHKKRIMNTKVIPGEECVHGHHLVVMDMHLKVRKYRKNHQELHKVQPSIKVWKLKKAYLEKLQERNRDIEDSVRVEEQWDKVEKAMTEVAAIVCGVTKGKCRQRETWWWYDEVEKAVETKKQKLKEWKKAEEYEKDVKQAEYKASRMRPRDVLQEYRLEVMKEQVAETLDSKEGRQNIFRIGKQKKKERKERKDITGTNCLKGDNGELLVSEEQVSDRWREYFEKLLNEENEWNDELSAEYVEGPADMISKEEVRQAIQDLKVRKAAGPSGVTGEMIKAAGEQAVDWLTSICNRIVKEAIAESWQMSELVPIYKGKGDVLECSSS